MEPLRIAMSNLALSSRRVQSRIAWYSRSVTFGYIQPPYRTLCSSCWAAQLCFAELGRCVIFREIVPLRRVRPRFAGPLRLVMRDIAQSGRTVMWNGTGSGLVRSRRWVKSR